MGANVWDVAFAAGAVWATNNRDATVARIDPRRNRVVRNVRTGGAPAGLHVAFGSTWVGNNHSSRTVFFRINPATNRVTRIDTRRAAPAFFAHTPDAVWVVNSAAGSVSRVDPATNRIVATIEIGGQLGDGATAADGSVWVPVRDQDVIARIDPATNAVVERIPSGKTPFVLNEAFGDVWVPSFGGEDVWRFRSRT